MRLCDAITVCSVIPANAGIQFIQPVSRSETTPNYFACFAEAIFLLDSRFRGNDEVGYAESGALALMQEALAGIDSAAEVVIVKYAKGARG